MVDVESVVESLPITRRTHNESYVALSGLEIGSTVEVYNTVGMLLGTSEATDTDVKIDTVPGVSIVVVRKPGATPVAITVRIP